MNAKITWTVDRLVEEYLNGGLTDTVAKDLVKEFYKDILKLKPAEVDLLTQLDVIL